MMYQKAQNNVADSCESLFKKVQMVLMITLGP